MKLRLIFSFTLFCVSAAFAEDVQFSGRMTLENGNSYVVSNLDDCFVFQWNQSRTRILIHRASRSYDIEIEPQEILKISIDETDKVHGNNLYKILSGNLILSNGVSVPLSQRRPIFLDRNCRAKVLDDITGQQVSFSINNRVNGIREFEFNRVNVGRQGEWVDVLRSGLDAAGLAEQSVAVGIVSNAAKVSVAVAEDDVDAARSKMAKAILSFMPVAARSGANIVGLISEPVMVDGELKIRVTLPFNFLHTGDPRTLDCGDNNPECRF